MRTRLSIALALVPALVCVSPLRAEEKSRPEPDVPRFEASVEVEAILTAEPTASTVATRMPSLPRDLPLSVATVARPLLDEQAALVLGDALENVSGVNVATGFGVFDFFVIRGFDSLTSGLVLTDGLPEPESTYYPMYNVRQVEVLKGPASFLLGGNPLAGAVQLDRKQPQAKTFADAVVGYGRYDTFETSLDANAATADGRLAARVNATWQGTEAYRDLPSGSTKAVNPTLTWRPDPKTRLFFDYEFVRSDWPPDTGIPFVGASGEDLAPVPRTRSYQTPYDASTQDVQRARFEAERRVSDSLVLRNRLYFTELTWESDGTLVNGAYPFPDGRDYVVRTLVLLDDRQRFFGDQIELGASFSTGSVKHDLLAGFEIRSQEDRFTQDVAFLPPIDLLAPVETAQPPFADRAPARPAGRLERADAGAVRRRPPPPRVAAPGVRRRAPRRAPLRGSAERDRPRRHPRQPHAGPVVLRHAATSPSTRAGAPPRPRPRPR